MAEKVALNDLPLVDSGHYDIYEPFTDSYDNQYNIGYKFDASENAYAVYGLKGQYSTFSGTIVCSDKTGSGADMSIMIYKDDDPVPIATITDINKQTETRLIEQCDIKDARKLIIRASNNGEYSCGWCFLVNAFVE